MAQTKIGTTITKFLKLKAKITAETKKVEALKSEANAMSIEIIKELESTNAMGADVKAGSVKLKEEIMFSAKDWKKVWKWIFKNNSEDILQKRLSQPMLRELLEDGVKIPGLEKMTKKSLSIGRKRS